MGKGAAWWGEDPGGLNFRADPEAAHPCIPVMGDAEFFIPKPVICRVLRGHSLKRVEGEDGRMLASC